MTDSQRRDPADVILEFIGPGASNIRGVFASMSIAEEEIAKAKERFPLAEFAIHKSFEILCPDLSLFTGKHEALYRSHCQELLARVADGAPLKDIRLGTRAEVLCVLSNWSLENPPGAPGAALMSKLFGELFPESDLDDSSLLQEPWPESNNELFGALQRKVQKMGTR